MHTEHNVAEDAVKQLEAVLASQVAPFNQYPVTQEEHVSDGHTEQLTVVQAVQVAPFK